MKFKICVLILALTSFSSYSQTPKDLSEWNDNCYCSMNNSLHPAEIVGVDNNWQLLWMTRNGVTLEELDSLKVPYNKSQLLLLISQKLVKKDGKIYKSLVPILDGAQTLELRSDSKKATEKIYPQIRNECGELINYLGNAGMKGNAFSILFSYVFDGIVWDMMESVNLINEKDGDELWSGNYWFLENKRDFSCGTNSMSVDETTTLHINWAYPLLESDVNDYLFDWQYISPFLMYAAKNKEIGDMDILAKWKDWGVISGDGSINIPVIDTKEQSGINHLSNKIADKVLQAFIETADLNAIGEKYGFANDGETIVVFYHEVMWDIINKLAEEKIINIPPVLTNANNSDQSMVKDIIFMTK